MEQATLAEMNSDQLEEGANQDSLTKETGGVVYFNLTKNQEPVSLNGFDDEQKKLTRIQLDGFQRRIDIF